MGIGQIQRAQAVLSELSRAGMAEVVLCAGARNAPFVALLAKARGLTVHSFFDERAAGFFAIGRMLASGRAVAVCTTSGTAVAELLPAVVEADYQNLPLIVLSADRPPSHRGTGSPQTIVQPGIFSHYVEKSWDIEFDLTDFHVELGARPVHVNVCFEEPLLDAVVEPWSPDLAESASAESGARPVAVPFRLPFKRPLVIAGGLSPREAAIALPLLTAWRRPVYAEALSHLRGAPELMDLEVIGGEAFLGELAIDGVIRIGQVPTTRFWRDLERSDLPVINFSSRAWSGLAREKDVRSFSTLVAAEFAPEPWSEAERSADRARATRLDHLCREFPLSECAFVRRFSTWLPTGARLFVGNSLPICEWDLVASRAARPEVFANRGVNGIDGLVSTFIGVAEFERPSWALIGDLSALYDLSGPWAARGRPYADLTLAVMNNGGGKIFERIFKDPLFENRHNLDFSAWAKMWGWNYQRLSGATESPEAVREGVPRILEIVPDARHTNAFYDALERRLC